MASGGGVTDCRAPGWSVSLTGLNTALRHRAQLIERTSDGEWIQQDAFPSTEQIRDALEMARTLLADLRAREFDDATMLLFGERFREIHQLGEIG